MRKLSGLLGLSAAVFLSGCSNLSNTISTTKVAAVTGAPIFQTFVVREKLGHYRFFSFPAKFIPREILRAGTEALQPHVAEYAARLADVAKRYPFQWFNIFPFWDETSAAGEPEFVSADATAPAKSAP